MIYFMKDWKNNIKKWNEAQLLHSHLKLIFSQIEASFTLPIRPGIQKNYILSHSEMIFANKTIVINPWTFNREACE